jgi:hypothetical protein
MDGELDGVDEMRQAFAQRIAAAGSPTEAQMREMKAPVFDSATELADYIRALTDRPHDYGTCVYAMSLAATAAFNHVAHKLGVTGFQASCADLDILRQTRGFNWGRLLNFDDLLYPQYRNHFPGWEQLIEENRGRLAEEAAKLLAARGASAHPDVRAHWEMLAAPGPKV